MNKILFVYVLVCILLVPNAFAFNYTENLLHYWDFNEGEGTISYDIHAGNNAELIERCINQPQKGFIEWIDNGTYDKALYLHRADCDKLPMTIMNNADIDMTFTLGGWFYINQTEFVYFEHYGQILYGEPTRANLNVAPDYNRKRIALFIPRDDRRVRFEVRTQTGFNNDYDYTWWLTDNLFTSSGWYHFMVVRNNSNFYLYINGIKQDWTRYALDNTLSPDQNNFSLYPAWGTGHFGSFGGIFGAYGSSWTIVDEFGIWNESFSDEKVYELFQRQDSQDDSGIYPFFVEDEQIIVEQSGEEEKSGVAGKTTRRLITLIEAGYLDTPTGYSIQQRTPTKTGLSIVFIILSLAILYFMNGFWVQKTRYAKVKRTRMIISIVISLMILLLLFYLGGSLG